MPTVSTTRIAALLEPFLPEPALEALYTSLSRYLDLLVRWNGRTNLTSIRDPEEIVQRHFGESLFAASQLTRLLPEATTLLDFGSGAGFPGLPIQLFLPQLQITLAESQGKKAAFLREAIRVLGLPTQLWSRRVQDMPAISVFDIVALRAVDNMEDAVAEARRRVTETGHLLILGGQALADVYPSATIQQLPESSHRFLILVKAQDVPRGTFVSDAR